MFRIRPFEAKTLSWWYNQRDSIDTSPPYQRGGRIWNAEAKAYLVDSILNEFDIPKLYVADFSYMDSPLNVSNMQFALIDGKQRLEAIFDFYANSLKLHPDFVLYRDPSLKLGGLTYKDLSENYPRVASTFDNFNLSVMSVITDEATKINDLFLRLNTSKPLSGPEYRNAMQGIVPELIRDITSHSFFKDVASFAMTRNADQQVAAKFLLVEFRGEMTDTKRAQLDRMVIQGAALSTTAVGYSGDGEATDAVGNQLLGAEEFVEVGTEAEAPISEFTNAAKRVQDVLDIMTEVFSPRDPLLSTQGPLVIYYWFLREHGYRPDFREFLLNFERQRDVNRRRMQASESDSGIDQELATYDNLGRSVNDSGSLTGRYRILSGRYDKWLSARRAT